MRRGPAEHSTGPLTCTFAVVPNLRAGANSHRASLLDSNSCSAQPDQSIAARSRAARDPTAPGPLLEPSRPARQRQATDANPGLEETLRVPGLQQQACWERALHQPQVPASAWSPAAANWRRVQARLGRPEGLRPRQGACRASQCAQGRLHVRARAGDDPAARAPAALGRTGPPQEWCEERQPSGEPGTVGRAPAQRPARRGSRQVGQGDSGLLWRTVSRCRRGSRRGRCATLRLPPMSTISPVIPTCPPKLCDRGSRQGPCATLQLPPAPGSVCVLPP